MDLEKAYAACLLGNLQNSIFLGRAGLFAARSMSPLRTRFGFLPLGVEHFWAVDSSDATTNLRMLISVQSLPANLAGVLKPVLGVYKSLRKYSDSGTIPRHTK